MGEVLHMGGAFYAQIFGAGLLAGAINAVAGGGPILTLGILSISGIDPRIANITSTVALCPGQLAAGYSARAALGATKLGKPAVLLGLALAGGGLGAVLLLLTSSAAFKAIVPWLVLVATAIYAWSGTRGAAAEPRQGGLRQGLRTASLVPLAVYGGYFGGGNSFLVLALLGLAGHGARDAGTVKNALIAAINLGAVAVLAFSGLVDWRIAVALGAGGVVGSMAGVRLFAKLPVAAVRLIVILFGLGFSAWMLVK